jgi:hypothetical protein
MPPPEVSIAQCAVRNRTSNHSVCLSGVRPFVSAAMLVAIAVVAACNSKSTPTAPTPPTATTPTATTPLPIPAPSSLRLASLSFRDRTALVTWNAVPEATSYSVDVGTGSGGADVASLSTGSASVDLSNLPAVGNVYVSVRSRRDGASSSSATQLVFYMQDYKLLVEALMLGTGPYATPVPPNGDDVVRGWPAGTTVRIRISNTVTAPQRRGLENVAAQLAQAGAPIRATFEVTNSNQTYFARNELQVVTLDNACGTNLGCASFADTALRQDQSSKLWGNTWIYLGPSGTGGDDANVAAHEMGHALFGLNHVWFEQVPEIVAQPRQFGAVDYPYITMYNGVMPRGAVDRLWNLEMQVLQDVFRAGISAGSRRADLRARGLIH